MGGAVDGRSHRRTTLAAELDAHRIGCAAGCTDLRERSAAFATELALGSIALAAVRTDHPRASYHCPRLERNRTHGGDRKATRTGMRSAGGNRRRGAAP